MIQRFLINKEFLGGDFNLIFNHKLETNGGNSVLKKEFSSKISPNKGKSESLRYLKNTKVTKKVTHFIRIKFLVSFKEN